jgi:putative peptidoglycan lipid II flippase
MQAALVAAGIFLSRVLGLVREGFKTAYLGASGSVVADAFNAAFRIPNLLQNLFGEGALSASFIPVYANLLARGDRKEADRVAGAVGSLLALVTAMLVLLGVVTAPFIVGLVAPGFDGARRDLTIQLIRILFPGAALFVYSAWCLGILNSHRRFFLSYAAPVAWNGAMIGALYVFRDAGPEVIVVRLAWASVAGAALQTLVQLPTVLSVATELRGGLGRGDANVAQVLRNFVPAFFGRGVVQVNAYVDQWISSYLPVGSVTLLFSAQTITLLPISLFGMAISASELPEMSSATGDASATNDHIRTRLQDGLRRMAFFVVPSAIAFIMLGDVITAALYQRGLFTATDTRYVWGIMAAAGIGLMASTSGRLYSSAFYALRDTRTPLRYAIIRVSLAAGAGWVLAMRAPGWFGLTGEWGTAALALSSTVAGWVEFLLLRAKLRAVVGPTGLEGKRLTMLWIAAVASGGVGYGIKVSLPSVSPLVGAIVIIGAFGVTYFALTAAMGVETAMVTLKRLRRGAR